MKKLTLVAVLLCATNLVNANEVSLFKINGDSLDRFKIDKKHLDKLSNAVTEKADQIFGKSNKKFKEYKESKRQKDDSYNKHTLNEFVMDQDMYRYTYDGDTITIKCIEGLICQDNKLSIRAVGVDTPELKGKCQSEIELARKAKQHTVSIRQNASTIVVLVNEKRPYDRYGRLLAEIYFDGVKWSDSLINAGLGRPWRGRREPWC